MKSTIKIISIAAFLLISSSLLSQVVITNTNFSMGTTGRIGIGMSPNGEGMQWKPLNLSGQGSLAGRMEQYDYMDLLPAIHFTPKSERKDTTSVTFQVRLGMYSQNGQFMGNVSSRSPEGLTFILPETYVEAKNIMGSDWSAWVGVRFRRYDDIHICDYFYFDDHSAQGAGFSYKNTEFAVYMPSSSDSSGVYPYNYQVTVEGATNPAIRQRMVFVGEHTMKLNKSNSIKLLGEYHYVSENSENTDYSYPSDYGWVLGAKLNSAISTKISGSFNQFAVRFGSGIANGGDNGNTWTWATYGAPNEKGKYTGAYSLAVVEHFLLNLHKNFSINGYGIYTNSKGGASSSHKATFFDKREIYNRKTDFVVGARTMYYAKKWLHLINEVHYATRKDGNDPTASMWKFSFAPTIVPLGKKNAWCRPHIRLVMSAAKYNDYAKNNHYSPYLQLNNNSWGTYIGIKTEMWLF